MARLLAPLIAQGSPKLQSLPIAKDHTLDAVLGAVGAAGSVVGVALLCAFGPAVTSIVTVALAGPIAATNVIGGVVTTTLSAAPTALGFAGSAVAGIAATTGIGVLIVMPALVGGILKIVDVARGNAFEKALDKARKDRSNTPDLHKMYTDTKVDSAGLCYEVCRRGYAGAGPLCYENCPKGFPDHGAFCGKPASYSVGGGFGWRPGDPPFNYSYARRRCERRFGRCRRGGLIWYPLCRTGFHKVGAIVCSPNCPAGMRDIGVSCQKRTYRRGVGARCPGAGR